MKKALALLLALAMVFALCACGQQAAPAAAPAAEAPAAEAPAAEAPATEAPAAEAPAAETGVEPDLSYTIRIYSNSNSTERVTWLVQEAKEAGFNISLDTNEVISGDTAAIQAANENKDGDLIFGLNETRWSQLIKGQYENLAIRDWTPTWADEVGDFKYDGKAYGIVIQNVLMLYRNDELGTKGEELHFDHWADVVDSGYSWYRQNKVGGTTNMNINSAILYPFADPASPAGGISIDGWKTLWKFCADGKFGGDDYKYGFDPLNKGDVAISEFYSSALYGKIDAKAGRTDAQTAAVEAFAEWFGSAEVQAAWGEEFDSYPCNQGAADELYPDGIPAIYQIPNFALNQIAGTDLSYAEYVAAHNAEWTNIMTNLGFYWKDASEAPAEPDWDNLDWSVLTQKAE